ncbi:hypothetical protein DE146DRAFT_638448 [Phaeosphaeria sp. MPI-PUGE-AT-0046c]|nr:hypothetical protein DE146DRAFT_638448 [Phaeosphaeria sp. MPI-PUGE-AT-0046c]
MRVASLGDYLISLSKSIVLDQPAPAAAAKTAARSRLVPLLVINDVLHTDKFHPRSATKSGVFSKEVTSYLPELVDLATAYVCEPGSHAEKKLRALLNHWAVNQVLGTDEIKSLRDHTDEGLLIAQGGIPVRKRNYLLPEYHGDRQAQWYDLPASYMLDQMIKHPHRPVDLHRIKPTKFDKKPVTPRVRNLLDNYFDNIDLKYVPTGDNPTGETKKYKLWLDPMGQLIKQHKESGKISTVYNGYGWSAKLCQDVQKDGVPETIRLARDEALHEAEMDSLRPAPQERTSDHRYHSPPRRRRSSSLDSDSDHRRGRGRRNRSHSRPSSRSSYDSRQDHRQGSWSNVRARSRSRRGTSPHRERPNSRDRDRHYQEAQGQQQRPPPRPYGKSSFESGQHMNRPDAVRRDPSEYAQYPPPPPSNNNPGYPPPPPIAPPPFSGPPFQSHPGMPIQFPGQFPMQPFPPPAPFQQGGFPGSIPPPPPPNYSGPFPPPPPNMTAMPNTPYSFGGNQTSHGNNVGYGQNPGPGSSQGNHRGGQGGQGGRGGFRGNKQGGGYGNRGGYNQQRGHRGGW